MVNQSITGTRGIELIYSSLSTYLGYLGNLSKRFMHSLRFDFVRIASAKTRQAYRHTAPGYLVDVFSIMPVGMVVLDSSGTVTLVNPAAVQILGKTPQGQIWREVVQQAFKPDITIHPEASTRSGLVVNVTTCALPGQQGQLVMLADVTASSSVRKRREHKHRLVAMGKTLASLAHQIRTPLATAMLYATSRSDDLTRNAENTNKIQTSLRHLDTLVNNMLLYARDQIISREIVRVAELLVDLEELLRAEVEKHGARLSINDYTKQACISGNRAVFITALQNLVINAIEASDAGAEIKINAELCDAEKIEITVSDNGPGIDPDIVEQIFNPFFSTKGSGTGLGLAVVSTIVQAHDGELWTKSQPGQGVTFGIRLPKKSSLKDVISSTSSTDMAA
jgi:two-component system, sensor histidine kinase FlrB